jgi:hypothetical protein
LLVSRTTKVSLKNQNDRNAAPGGMDSGKPALERGTLACSRLAAMKVWHYIASEQ